MSNLVKIPQEVAAKLDQLREYGYSTRSILSCYYEPSDTYAVLRTIPYETFIQAVVNGFHREKTDDEKHAELAAVYNGCDLDIDYDDGVRVGIVRTLDILGITVEGINNKTEVSTNER